MSLYDSDDAFPQSPGLVPVRPKATPSPSPPPFVTQQVDISSTARDISPPPSRRRKGAGRRQTRPSQGDFVLIQVMDPNRLDIARKAGEEALNWDSGPETDEEDMEEQSETGAIDADQVTATRSHSIGNADSYGPQPTPLPRPSISSMTNRPPPPIQPPQDPQSNSAAKARYLKQGSPSGSSRKMSDGGAVQRGQNGGSSNL
ncbi:hypothetical protein N0V90_012843 [Kalmusia sp. IMI 367209]|nr:hypothetical protein N0V90_012843 [Kalmusia sp. IMI 367209]